MPNYGWENVFLTVMRHVFLIEISKISQFLFGVYSDYDDVGMKTPYWGQKGVKFGQNATLPTLTRSQLSGISRRL